MKIRSKILGAALLTAVSVGSLTNVAYASEYVHENGTIYVKNWDNYIHSNCNTCGVTLEDACGNKPFFALNRNCEWVSDVVTVKGCGYFPFKFYSHSNNIKVIDFDSGKEITDGYLRGGQRIYIISKDDPTHIRLSI
ncbi:hypothetical protein [Clostridium perfringens]|uniref:hypothetical protein n=1 Tax=Clostridium perfringens TaxID=1502 RepID=UPI0024BD031D|nr:hypothetical protein [Clostridium perfringens]